jgi:hypothetical protein
LLRCWKMETVEKGSAEADREVGKKENEEEKEKDE